MIQINWVFFIEASICFSFLYLVYFLFFRNLSHHTSNRIILMVIMLVSLIVPKLNLQLSIPDNSVIKTTEFVLGGFDGIVQNLDKQKSVTNNPQTDYLFFLKLIYGIGFIIFAYRFVYQLIRILIIRFSNTTEKQNKVRLIFINKNISPFSFFYWIFMPSHMHANRGVKAIIEHEKVHARQWHTLDLLLAELFGVFFWFVPFVYSFKNSIKNVHEFLADSNAIKQTTKIDYLKLLSAETEKYTLIGLSSNFYSKTLKKRITMITKNKSNKYSKYLYLLLIPVVGILIQSFSTTSSVATKHTIVANEKPLNKPANKVAFIQPIDADKCSVSSEFGMRWHPIKKKEMMHNAIDYKAAMGTPVKASASGKVIKVEFKEGSYGKLIVIEHSQGFHTLYAQLSEFKCTIGDNVEQGQTIGLVGSSGMSTGPHLHFEIRKDGEHVNPADFLIK